MEQGLPNRLREYSTRGWKATCITQGDHKKDLALIKYMLWKLSKLLNSPMFPSLPQGPSVVQGSGLHLPGMPLPIPKSLCTFWEDEDGQLAFILYMLSQSLG